MRDAVYDGLPERRASLHGAISPTRSRRRSPRAARSRRRRSPGTGGAPERTSAPSSTSSPPATAPPRAPELREALAFFAEALEIVERSGGGDWAQALELLDAMGRVQLGLSELGGAARSRTRRASGAPNTSPRPSSAPAHRLAAIALAGAGRLRAAAVELEDGLAVEAQGEEAAALLHLRAQLLWHERRPADALVAAGHVGRARGRATRTSSRAARTSPPSPARCWAIRSALLPPRRLPPSALPRTSPEHPVPLHLVLWDRDLLGDATAGEVGEAAALLAERARQREAAGVIAAGRHGEGRRARRGRSGPRRGGAA